MKIISAINKDNKQDELKVKKINDTQKENINEIYNNEKESFHSKEELKNISNIYNLIKENSINLLEKIEKLEYLGSGGESNVYKMKPKKSKQTYLFKLIISQNRKNKNKNELKSVSKLKHSNIINFISYIPFKKSNIDSILMEYCLLGDLRKFLYNQLNRCCFSESFLCYITLSVLKGLKYIQINKIVHYDIKPENIVIDEQLNIKIIDFSESVNYKEINSEKIKLKYCGTGFYMAPEVIKEKVIDLKDINKIDLYSLGVLLYKFAFCSYPYSLNYDEDYKNDEQIYNKIMNNKVEFDDPNEEYSELFKDFEKKLLEKDISKRININESLEHPWVKAGNILIDEKEKLYNGNSFLINLMMDNFYSFNEIVKN
jgi:serine/threonine protein kinase